MSLLKSLTISILFGCLVGCSSDPAPNKEEKSAPTPNAIVLVFDHSPLNQSYRWPEGPTSMVTPPHEVRYIDDNGIVQYFSPDSTLQDTLTIHTERKRIEVQHAYLGMDHLSYLFEKGDSVIFRYSGKKPTATVLNREVSPLEVNYAMRKREKLSKHKFRGIKRTRQIFAFGDSAFKSIKDLHQRIDTARAVGIEATVAEYKAEIKWLDSLQAAKLLSPTALHFYSEKLRSELANLQLKGFNLTSLPSFTEEVRDQLALKLDGDKSDDQLSFHRQDFLRSFRYHRYLANTPMMGSANAPYPDYRQGYDSIRQDESLQPAVKKHLLFTTMNDILTYFPLDDRLAYWGKFKQDVPDSAKLHYLTQEYGLNKTVSKKLELATLDDQPLTFSELLAQNKNKLVYVDFWASWCAPCIRSLPAAHALKEKYKEQDVAFVYLSIDKDEAKWKAATEKYELADSLHSFVVANQNTSRMLDDLGLESIPRYLVYDQQGKLIHENAPGPGSEEIERIFDAYLN